jgi:hypothetical protein
LTYQNDLPVGSFLTKFSERWRAARQATIDISMCGCKIRPT